jgi:hypothetical protein
MHDPEIQLVFGGDLEESKEYGPKGPGFRLPPEGASIVSAQIKMGSGVRIQEQE